jgi:putative methyltransferase (TIGR04325 family)
MIKELLPPIFRKLLLRLGFGGNRFTHGLSSWEEASKKSSGYDAQDITTQLVQATRKVRDGEFAYERDGVLFQEIQYSWPLLTSLLSIPREGKSLRVLDWGGSLGSTYRQNRAVLESAGIELEWVVIEQPHLVKIGESEFADGTITFESNLEGFNKGEFDVALFASSICYVPDAEAVLSSVASLAPKRLIFDRTPVSIGLKDSYGVQKVGSKIYKASYPIRSFGRGKIESILKPTYTKQLEWECELQPDPQTVSKGYLFSRSDLI